MKKKVILIPNDENVYILLLSIQLRKMGFKVISFLSEKELVASTLKSSPDMIFIDKGVTGMDFRAALINLKENDSTSSLPVVVISSDSSEAVREECLELGAESYLLMPISIRETHEVLQRCLYIPMGYQRDYLRVCFSGRVMVTHEGIGEWLYSETLSEKGIYIRKKYPYQISSELTVSIPLIEEKTITIEGQVVYVNKESSNEPDEPSGMAIEFSEKHIENLIVISNYVEGLLMIPSVISMQNNITCGQ